MTQLLIDRATLEQLVKALEFINYLDCDINFLTTNAQEEIVDSALTAGRAALANAEPEEVHPLETHCPHGAPVEDYCKLCDMEMSEQFKDIL